MDETKVCKCCGAAQPLNRFDRSNNGRPISLCRDCRRAQQTIANISNMPDNLLTESRTQRLQEALRYMQACKEKTGFETGSTTKSATAANAVNKLQITSAATLKAKYIEAQERRKHAEAAGVTLQAPTLEMLKNSSIEFLVDMGYTAKECTDIIDAELNHDSDEYIALDDKLFAFPR